MSQENVELFKRAWDAGDRRDIEALLAVLDVEVEWHAALPMLGGDAVYRGHGGVRSFLSEVWEVLGDNRFEFPDIRDAGDRVVALGHFSARGEASGVPTETPFAYVADFKHGKAIRVRSYLDHHEALEAAGLRE
ncbi:MAG: nuclear transport factor 2 family protein [Actinomycetota bacterium]